MVKRNIYLLKLAKICRPLGFIYDCPKPIKNPIHMHRKPITEINNLFLAKRIIEVRFEHQKQQIHKVYVIIALLFLLQMANHLFPVVFYVALGLTVKIIHTSHSV